MVNALKTQKKHTYTPAGFTVVELIVVIVIIAILATIIVVGYRAVTRQAVEASMKSDLKTAADQLASDYFRTKTYPSSADQADGGRGLKTSENSQLSYIAMQKGYCISITNDESQAQYHLDSSKQQVEDGPCGTYVGQFVGSVTRGFANGSGNQARFDGIFDLAADKNGTIYVADTNNHRIRKVAASGVVSTLAGSGVPGYVNGTGGTARFENPMSVSVDNAGNVYTSEYAQTQYIRKITPAGSVSNFAGSGVIGYLDGPVASARFMLPYGMVFDSTGNAYLPENSMIRKITPSGVVSTFAGVSGSHGSQDGQGSAARFGSLRGIAIDNGGTIYAAEQEGCVRKITPSGVVSTFAGTCGVYGFQDGQGTAARFQSPSDIALDSDGNLYVADRVNCAIRKITPAAVVSTLAGSPNKCGSSEEGAAGEVRVDMVDSVAVSGKLLYFASSAGSGSNAIYKINL